MNLYLDTSSGQLALAAGGNNASISIPCKLGTTLMLSIFPNTQLSPAATAVMTAKPNGQYSAAPVALAPSWSAPSVMGAGYAIALQLNSGLLAALFPGPPVLSSVTLMADITIVDTGLNITTQTISLAVANSVGQPGDGTPSAALAKPSFLLSSLDGSQWQVSIGNDGQLSQTKLS